MQITNKGKKVGMQFDLFNKPRESSSGKSDILYSTGGYIPAPDLGDGAKVMVTVIKPKAKGKAS